MAGGGASPAAPRGAPDTSPHVTPAAYVTADERPLGGRLKDRPEDFLVEELPLYQPSGDGEHIYLFVEKRGLSGIELADTVAKHFGVGRRAVGYAGLKDKIAVTRQVVSVHAPGRPLESFPSLQHPKLSVLWADRHENKLRRGHLAGNRFSIKLRGVNPLDARTAQRVLSALERTGVPDRIGEQRFGYLANNHLVGRALLTGDWDGAVALLLGRSERAGPQQAGARDLAAAGDLAGAAAVFGKAFATERDLCLALHNDETPEQALLSMDPEVMGYYVSAFQSAVFNAVLDRRIADGTLGVWAEGDLAVGPDGKGLVAVDDAALASPKLDLPGKLARFDLGPSGPMWGTEMSRARGAVDEAEADALRRFGLRPEDLARGEQLGSPMLRGARRPLRVPLRNVEVEGGVDEHGGFVRCAFDLPRGAFATTVMAEVMKPALLGEPPIEPDLSRLAAG